MSDGPLFETPIRDTYGDKTLDVKMVDTSREKLDAMDNAMAETQERILNMLDKHPEGLGATQVAELLSLPLLSARPAMTILKRKGLVFDTGVRRLIGKRSKEAVMTSHKEHADPELIGSGQLARTADARIEELLDLKGYINREKTSGWGWGNSPFVTHLLEKIDQRVKDIRDDETTS